MKKTYKAFLVKELVVFKIEESLIDTVYCVACGMEITKETQAELHYKFHQIIQYKI